jgi:PAS domain S-box-containing protein
MRWSDYLEESPEGLRRLVILLYLAVLPPFAALLFFVAPPGERAAAVLAVVAICAAAVGWVALRQRPGPYDWVYPGGIAPTVCCGLAFAEAGPGGLAFLAVLGAPLAWSAILFDRPAVIGAWITGTATCFVLTLRRAGLPSAAGNALVFAVIHGLVAWVVHGRAARHREARLRSLERHMNDIELMMRLDGTIVVANDRAVEAYGHPRHELLGMNIRDLRLTAAEVSAQMKRAADQGSLVFESLHRRRDGSSFPVEVSSRRFEVGGEVFLHSLIRDITVRKAMDAALRESELSLREALAAEKRFLALISHEIRTPLNTILGALDLLLDGALAERERGWVDKAHVSGRHLLALIEDILDVSKLDAGQLDVLREPFDLDALLGECLAMITPRAGVALQASLSEVDVELVGDPRRVRQIVLNLLGNAAKFTAQGKIALTARVSRADGAARVLIEVEDTGEGIPEGRLASLFQPFRQAHGAHHRGTGLGLYLARSLAKLMGGDVTVESEAGSGSRFCVALALGSGGPLQRSERTPELRRTASDLRGMRVLVAEDEPFNAMVIEEMLRSSFGIVVERAADGAVAVEKLCASTYDLVLMDLQMPMLDGAEATRQARAAGVTAPIVAVTASALGDQIEAAMAAGMNGYLAKPVRRAELERLVLARAPAQAAGAIRARLRAHFLAEGGERAADKLVEVAMASLVVSLHSLREARAAGDEAAVGAALHRLRGLLLNGGLIAEGEAARALERRRGAPGWDADVDALARALEG